MSDEPKEPDQPAAPRGTHVGRTNGETEPRRPLLLRAGQYQYDGKPSAHTGAVKPRGEPRQPLGLTSHEISRRANESRLAQAKVKHIRCFQLKLAGFSIPQIAQQMGYNPKTVHQILQRQLKAYRTEALEETVAQAEARLDQLLISAWGPATNIDVPVNVRLQAIDRVLRIEDQRLKLHGFENAMAERERDRQGLSGKTEVRQRIMARLEVIEERRRSFEENGPPSMEQMRPLPDEIDVTGLDDQEYVDVSHRVVED